MDESGNSTFRGKFIGGGETGSMKMCRAVRWYVSIYIALWYVHVPRTDQNRPRYVAIDIEVRAHT